MPTYEYECERCGHRFERFQSMTEEPVKRCPKCRGKVRRLLSGGAGFLFKGSGFYTTDYRSPEYKKKEKEEKSSTSGSGTEKKEQKKEQKPDTKKENKKKD